MSAPIPESDLDYYSDAVIENPYPHYAKLRDLGAVVYLSRHNAYALPRYRDVKKALRDHRRFSSAEGVAGDAFGCSYLRGNTVASDPPRHTALRQAMATPLMPDSLENVKPQIDLAARQLIDRLLSMEEFDGIIDLARHLPLTIVRELVGLPDFGQENMLRWAGAAFDILGCQNARGQNAVPVTEEMRAFIADKLTRTNLRPDSFTWRILDLVDQEKLDPDLAPFALRDYMNPSLDTTIAATGQLIWQLSKNPEQWAALRAAPDKCRNAVNEAVRLGAPIRSFTRLTTEAVEIEDYMIPAGSRVMLIFASANRDADQFSDPDRFDITRHPRHHLGFGFGIHMCVGMHLAQMEMIALLEAMIPRVRRINVGAPTIAMNNTIHAFATLPCRFERDATVADFPAPS